MKLKSLLLASTVALLAATGAKAADAIIAEEPAPVIVAPTFTWNGAYIGGQIGYGWGKSRFDADGFDLGNVKPDGFLGGLYAGYNFDLGNSVVLGIDGDVTYNNLKDSASIFNAAGVDTGVSLESKLRWSGAVRARAGYAVDRFLPYIAGGVAFGSVKNSLDNGIDSISQSKTLTGWTAGAGIDYAATDNVIVRLEYRYTDYGHKDFDFGVPDAGVRDKFKTNEVRLGVAYKF
ncbi:outer membrane protein [Brucella pseudogrignonensis]|uniref:outer membrane protein n=1 Tax=Brucella pseudogrignonensis TaxID=419475 RepID=UPI000CFB6785|nr:outer membrane protein [Brucella pseudogrignonensis]MQP39748.1 outer membrane beta-barrel protein [Ochrobactrum sp. MYb237]PQZ42508.1 autotransporter outer membrane beta-barrel domain-containing protein [Brucella pseudogrignonensis]PRA41938.1 autotransporter outer membrane beta-barrel domain-containing protein [Brucella pseudogrignonensis]PRA70636.1 autotransporter outer membrane beta-barrel domain-containing protein [Brucella pseudogrignonensis]